MSSQPKPKTKSAQAQGGRYRELEQFLRGQIAAGTLSSGSKLPSFVALQGEFGLSTTSINRALLNLEQDGLVERVRGSGVYVAQGNHLRRTGPFAFVGPTLDEAHPDNNAWLEPYWMELLAGVLWEAAALGREVLVCQPPLLQMEKAVGFLVHGEKSLSSPDQLPSSVPIVGVMESVRQHPGVLADSYEGAREATGHLLRLGHTRIGYLGFLDSPTVQQRLAGYHMALFQAGISPKPRWVRYLDLVAAPSRAHIGHHNMKAWLEQGFLDLGVTALLVQEDHFVSGVVDALAEAGLKVPGDFSVVGYDGLLGTLPSGQTITSVRVPLETVGRQAVRLLDRWVNSGNPGAVTITEPVRLVLGQTTGPVPRSRASPTTARGHNTGA